jgi:polysaccharide export outer membrane protein
MMASMIKHLILVVLALLALSVSAEEKQGDYQLGPGDTIRILVFQNPDLTLETRVSESGSVSYPLVGAVTLGGLTISAAEAKLAAALKEGGFVQQPQVNIALIQVRGNQVTVLGQVGRPGRFPLETFNTRLSDILAQAGGIAPGGADTVIFTGVRDGKPFYRVIDFVGIFVDKHGENDVVLAGGDIIYVHRMPMYYVYGEIQRPGANRLERGMFVMQALAQAGGPTQRGTEKRLRLFRRNAEGVLEKLSPELTDEVRVDDVIYVNERLF